MLHLPLECSLKIVRLLQILWIMFVSLSYEVSELGCSWFNSSVGFFGMSLYLGVNSANFRMDLVCFYQNFFFYFSNLIF